ncbi:MAG: chemotaxis-specific protein-glutamate methyltransferase CheB [Thermoanaerobaculaceae bacterium]|nr:chemotaxis-specific protein-glutamate methyltransferase CheB [Thermoanaerobaculaceae bacterium]TAM56630.1 MAG: chemotaxis-specific protein-glutamate methyltransferase CheB [Acidobacteriota bacterium]
MMADAPIGVLIVDDSATVRAVLRRLVAAAPGMRVVGEAADGAQGVEAAVRLTPAVILMDVEMPVLDGFAATERIMALCPTPILVITSRANRNQVQTAFEAIRRGAVEVLPKPEDAEGWGLMARTLPIAIRAAAQARVASGGARGRGAATGAQPQAAAVALPPQVRYVAVGASTGGPSALRDLLAALPPAPPAAILIVQHIAAGFEEGLTEWLAADLGRDVQIAADGEAAAPGKVRIAPGGAHLRLVAGGVLRVDAARPPRGVHRPSADELFESCAACCPTQTAGVLLTGMGTDGAQGLAALRRAGGFTMVQDEVSSVVFGMPRAALAAKAATIALPPHELGKLLARIWSGGA